MDLKAYLAETGIPPAAFAQRIGVGQGTVYRYLRGGRIPQPEVMERIALATRGQVTANDFYRLGVRTEAAARDTLAPPAETTNGVPGLLRRLLRWLAGGNR